MLHHDLQSLRLFVAICDQRSLSKAAARVNMALSAASRRLRLLEATIGTALVKRLPHGVEPTTAGVTALRYARSVLRLSDQLVTSIDEHRAGVRGRVRVFASSSALVQRLAKDLAAFSLAHREIKIDLEERPTVETIEALARNQADLGVIVRGVSTEGLQAHAYARDRLAIAMPAGHPLAHRRRVKLSALLDEEFVALDPGTAIHRLLVDRARDAGRVLKLRVQVRSFEVSCQMISHGLGIGILPETALRPMAEALGLRLVTLDEPWATREIDICVPARTELDAPTARLLDFLLKPRKRD